ncbi:MAG: 4-hydroxy-tetrahydrodipicolinate reductase [Deltaproteobacteria bacterium]|nr:4-hydroxy-tetrahydrodipicolinate reductase [Deltaproteobacteria bacterium]
MSTLEVVVAGAAGRLGSRIVARLSKEADCRPIALVRSSSQTVAHAAQVSIDASSVIVRGRVLVLAVPRDSVVSLLEGAVAEGVPTLIATTGLTSTESKSIEAAARSIPVLVAPNLSLGVAVLLELVERAAAALEGYDLEILELHHNKKRDAPSGTAWALARAAAKARGGDADRDAILARSGEIGPRGADEIGMSSIRGGDIVGEHTVFLIGPSERLELTHRASSRDVFADGAVRVVRFLADASRPAGRYGMSDVLLGRSPDSSCRP